VRDDDVFDGPLLVLLLWGGPPAALVLSWYLRLWGVLP
jgi:hypothetical protein